MTDLPAIPEDNTWNPPEISGVQNLLPSKPIVFEQDELNEVDESDLRTPVLSLDNGSEYAKQNRNASSRFFIELTDQVLEDPFAALVLWMQKGHILLPQADNPDHAGLERCVSFDTRRGTTYGLCEECRRCQWAYAKEFDRKTPLGGMQLTFGVLMSTGFAVFSVRSSALRQPKEYAAAAAMGGHPLYAYPTIFRVQTMSRQLPNGSTKTWNVPHMSHDRSNPVPENLHKGLRLAAVLTVAQRKQMFEAMLARAERDGVESIPDQQVGGDESIPF